MRTAIGPFALLLFCLCAAPAGAATFTVFSTGDDPNNPDPLSLRGAIIAANNNTGLDTIALEPAGTGWWIPPLDGRPEVLVSFTYGISGDAGEAGSCGQSAAGRHASRARETRSDAGHIPARFCVHQL